MFKGRANMKREYLWLLLRRLLVTFIRTLIGTILRFVTGLERERNSLY
jgi:hypothetical protein